MKNYLLLLLPLTGLFLSCSNNSQSDDISDEIKTVETGLTYPVYIFGDSTWTIESRMKHYGVPGVSIAVIKDYKIAWIKSYGVMDKESQLPVTPQTLFQAASISKPVTAYGALKLVDQNKVELDENVNTYLKSWKLTDNEFTTKKKVTLKNLLNHSAGITVHGFLGYSSDLPVPTLLEVLEGKDPANSPAIFVDKIPEDGFRYSGGGYTVLQQMMMDVEEKSFPKLMDELVLAPLEMSSSTFNQPLPNAQLKLAATGYLPDGSMTKGKRHTYPEMAAAGLWTTAEDLAKFTINIQQTLKGKNDIVLPQTMTEKMLTPFVEDFTGLGFFLHKKSNEVYFGHGGWDEGFSSELIAHKEKGYGVVILTNSNHPDFISELIRSVALTYNWEDYVPKFREQELDQNNIKRIVGRYRKDDENVVQVYQDNNQLFIKNIGEKPFRLIKISDTSYVNKEDDERIIHFKSNQKSEKYTMITRYHSGNPASALTQMKENEILPIEFLETGDFDQALEGYESLMKENPNNPAILEGNLNGLGYHFLSLNNIKLSQDIFKVNTILYPNSSNAYDSYAEASMKIGDLDLAMFNYKKSLSLDPLNSNAQAMIKELSER
ncbi:MAG: serine hydrolase [Gillisia sp.]